MNRDPLKERIAVFVAASLVDARLERSPEPDYMALAKVVRDGERIWLKTDTGECFCLVFTPVNDVQAFDRVVRNIEEENRREKA